MLSHLSTAEIRAELHCVGLEHNGVVHHCIRHTDGGWDPWMPLSEDQFVSISASGVEGELHLLAVNQRGDIFHNIRYRDGNWQGFVALPDQGPDPEPSNGG